MKEIGRIQITKRFSPVYEVKRWFLTAMRSCPYVMDLTEENYSWYLPGPSTGYRSNSLSIAMHSTSQNVLVISI